MTMSAAATNSIILGRSDHDTASSFYWLSPVMIGLVVPAILALNLFPALISHVQAIIGLMLALALIISILAYAVTVVVKGEPVGLEINRADRQVIILRKSPFATSRLTLDFTDVASLRFATFFDQDGYSEDGAELTTHDGTVYEFSGDIPRSQVEAARAALGLTSRAGIMR